jgi:hypothetical protein
MVCLVKTTTISIEMKINFAAEETEKMIYDYVERGHSCRAIARRHNCCYEVIKKNLQLHGVAIRKYPHQIHQQGDFSPEIIAKIVSLYKSFGLAKIALETGVAYNKIRPILVSQGVKIRAQYRPTPGAPIAFAMPTPGERKNSIACGRLKCRGTAYLLRTKGYRQCMSCRWTDQAGGCDA